MILPINDIDSVGPEQAFFAIAQYTENPIRRESTNVGIVAEYHGEVASQFLGDTNPCPRSRTEVLTTWTDRLPKAVGSPNAYRLWVDYWRKLLYERELRAAIDKRSNQYKLVIGGAVSNVADDSVFDLCNYLFRLLVSEKNVEATLEDLPESVSLTSEILEQFRTLDLMGSDLFRNYPITRNKQVFGASKPHKVSFYQDSPDTRFVIEPIDLRRGSASRIRERSSFLNRMFADLVNNKHADRQITPVTILQLLPNQRNVDDIDWAYQLLTEFAIPVDWGDDSERAEFLRERLEIASLG